MCAVAASGGRTAERTDATGAELPGRFRVRAVTVILVRRVGADTRRTLRARLTTRGLLRDSAPCPSTPKRLIIGAGPHRWSEPRDDCGDGGDQIDLAHSVLLTASGRRGSERAFKSPQATAVIVTTPK